MEQVFEVDSHTTYPPVPPKRSPPWRSIVAAQILLFLLVSLALCGLAIRACFMYGLDHPALVESASASKSIQDITTPPPTERPNPVVLPSKPVAHLTDGLGVVHGDQIMKWSMDAEPLLYDMEYKDGKLVIQKEGYYYIYSKVHFIANDTFHHFVCRFVPWYPKDVTLLESMTFSQTFSKNILSSNLGGVFHLFKNDTIFVKIKKIKQIVHRHNQNYFGAYMI